MKKIRNRLIDEQRVMHAYLRKPPERREENDLEVSE